MISFKKHHPPHLIINDILESTPNYELSPFAADPPPQQDSRLVICKPVKASKKHFCKNPNLDAEKEWVLSRLKIQNIVQSILKNSKSFLNFKIEDQEFLCDRKKDWQKNVKRWKENLLKQAKLKTQNEELANIDFLSTLVFEDLKNEMIKEEQLKQEIKRNSAKLIQANPQKNTIFNRYHQAACIILNKDFQKLYNETQSRKLSNFLDQALKMI